MEAGPDKQKTQVTSNRRRRSRPDKQQQQQKMEQVTGGDVPPSLPPGGYPAMTVWGARLHNLSSQVR